MQNNLNVQNMQNNMQGPKPICRIVTRLYFAYLTYICTPHFADAVCTSISIEIYVIYRLTVKHQVVSCALTSTCWNPAKSNSYRNLHPLWLCRMEHPLWNGWSMFTGARTLSCAGCPPSWQSGLGRTCRRSWVFQIRLIRGHSWTLDGLLPSWTVSCMIM